MKRYDEGYFERWYADPAIRSGAWLRRRVGLAVALAEFVLDRPVRSVLDIGCGTGRWRAAVRRLRPRARWVGVESSEWVLAHHGRRLGLVSGGFGELATLPLAGPFDLVICADVLHYLQPAELDAGLPALAALTGGVAWLETYARGDAIDGDLEGFQRRPGAWYRSRFEAAGLVQVGPQAWVPAGTMRGLTALERVPG
jgi:SAM-dependent methyltransferase